MKKSLLKLPLLVLALVAIAMILFRGQPKQQIGQETYIYGYPLVTMDVTRRQQTNVRVPDDAHAPMAQLINGRAYPAVDNHGPLRPTPTPSTPEADEKNDCSVASESSCCQRSQRSCIV
jgi:hypothetical protein